IRLVCVRMVDVDAQNGREQVADVLPRLQWVRWVRTAAVARGDVQVTIESKLNAAAVMPPRKPGDHDFLTRQTHGWRVGLRDRESRHARALREAILQHVADINVVIGLKTGVERNSIQ